MKHVISEDAAISLTKVINVNYYDIMSPRVHPSNHNLYIFAWNQITYSGGSYTTKKLERLAIILNDAYEYSNTIYYDVE